MTQSNKSTVAQVPNVFPLTVNGYTINRLENDPDFKYSTQTKSVGINGTAPTTIKFTRLSDARRWTRLN